MVRSGATASSSFKDPEAAFEEGLRRFKMWKEAGADIVWPRVYSYEHLIRARDELGGFLSQDVSSTVGQGRIGADGRVETCFTGRQYHELGYDLLTVSATMQTVIMKALADASKIMVESGGDSSKIDSMAMPFREWIELVNFSEWSKLNGVDF